MLTKERLRDIFHAHTSTQSAVSSLSTSQFDKVFELILEEQEDPIQRMAELIEITEYLDKREKENHHHYSGSLINRLQHHIGEEEKETRSAIADKKRLIEDALVYFRSVVMIAESIGMASTHAEKSARLRGLIELLNSAISKLRNEQQDSILNNWESFSWGYSDYPYKRILEKFNDMERKNKEMEKLLEENNLIDKLPF